MLFFAIIRILNKNIFKNIRLIIKETKQKVDINSIIKYQCSNGYRVHTLEEGIFKFLPILMMKKINKFIEIINLGLQPVVQQI